MKRILILLIITILGMQATVYGENIVMSWLDDIFSNNVVEINYLNGTSTSVQRGKGFLIITRKEELPVPEEINYTYGGTTYKIECKSQLKGYYIDLLYKPVVLGISKDNENYLNGIDRIRGVNYKGGLYTDCNGNGILSDAIIGWIKWEDTAGKDKMELYAGFEYDVKTNKVKFGEGYINSLRYVNGLKLVGYINSSIGGVGIMGVDMAGIGIGDIKDSMDGIKNKGIRLVGNEKVNIGGKIFRLAKGIINLGKIAVEGGVSMLSRGNIENNAGQILSTLSLKKGSTVGSQKRGSIIMLGGDINVAKVKNRVKKRVYELCRGRWEEISTDISYNTSNKLKNIECIKNVGTNPINVRIDYDPSQDGHKILVLGKGINLVLTNSMKGKGYMEVYMDGGNMLISNNIDLVKLNGNGEEVNVGEVTSGAVIKGVYVINGLIGGTNGGGITNFDHKLYIKGSILSLNTIGVPNEERVKYVNEIVGVSDKEKISLSSIFNWYCGEGGIGKDGVRCDSVRDKYRDKSLIIIKKYYNSELLK